MLLEPTFWNGVGLSVICALIGLCYAADPTSKPWQKGAGFAGVFMAGALLMKAFTL